MRITFPTKDPQAFERDEPCYIDEQGIVYTRADFLAACNGDEQVAQHLFALCYWQPPQFQFALFDESIPLAELSHHSRSKAHWLCFRNLPTAAQRKALQQGSWIVQDRNLRRWIIEGEEVCVPAGIAYRETGKRDRTPQEEEQFRAELSMHEGLTEAAKARHEQFVKGMHTDLEHLASMTCYKIEQIPEHVDAWNGLENANGRGLRALLLSSLAESVEELWQALDRLPANCSFIVTELKHLRGTAQIKAIMREGKIFSVQSRETESTLIPIFTACVERVNQEPLRERLLRRWREAYTVRQERIEEERHVLELVPLMLQMNPHAVNDEAAQTINAAKNILRMSGWQSAYSYACYIVRLFSDKVPLYMARGLLKDLAEKAREAETALEGAWSEIYLEVEEGRHQAFTQLLQEATGFLSTRTKRKEAPPQVIVFEFDLTFFGGDYNDVGGFVSVPVTIIEQLGGEEPGFEQFTGLSRCHVIHYSSEEENYDEEHSGPLDGQIPHQMRLAHYGECATCRFLLKEQRRQEEKRDRDSGESALH
jgi:hypothetical protein